MSKTATTATATTTITKATVHLEAKPERRLIRPGGSKRHVDFVLRADALSAGHPVRPPLTLALVLDRSGSMQGEKLVTAKRAVLSVLDQLQEQDRAALVVFDNVIDVIHEALPVTSALKRRTRASLGELEARGATALHEGWLTGCRAIAPGTPNSPGTPAMANAGGRSGITRCFLLTDGQANEGVVDPEQIAKEAGDIRAHAGIGTSTFGIGTDYDEGLLGPLAIAGGGQFHHLRTPEEIARTFVGELGGLLSVVASSVTLELETGQAVQAEVVSAYGISRPSGTSESAGNAVAVSGTVFIPVGDLMGGEEKHIVVRLSFPKGTVGTGAATRARAVWSATQTDSLTGMAVRHATEWHELRFTRASNAACDAELKDADVMHWVGLHHADKARREAAERSKRGDLAGAKRTLQRVSQHIQTYASDDEELAAALDELREVEEVVAAAPASAMVAKELVAESYRRSRGQRDHR